VYKRIEKCSNDHPGRDAFQSLLNSFDIDSPDERHRCLVHPPLWDSLPNVRYSDPIWRLLSPVQAIALQRMFQALGFLLTECRIAHTDIKEGNICFGADDSVLHAFEHAEL
jgi:serine/threonine-protein kinase SRPK3